MKKTWKTRVADFWRQFARPFLFIAIVLTAFRSSVADWNDVPTGSMRPSILEGDRIFVNKLAYGLKVPYTTWHLTRWGQPQRGDIVVFFSPVDGTRLVKRVVALPGDLVAMYNDRLIINGTPAEYLPPDPAVVEQIPANQQPGHQFAAEKVGQEHYPVMITPGISALRTFGPLIVPEGHYWVMGDNRDNSADSRYIGPIPQDQIVGRASRVVASLNMEDHFLPRWERFFTKLP